MKTVINAKIIFESDYLEDDKPPHQRREQPLFCVDRMNDVLNEGKCKIMSSVFNRYMNDPEIIVVIRQVEK